MTTVSTWPSAPAGTTMRAIAPARDWSSTSGTCGPVSVDAANGTVTAQPGARNTTIYAGLQPYNVAISAGRCPTVAVGGLVLGGGIGFSSRKMGLTCDHLVSAKVVTADGRLLTCSERDNSDLFWALRGGGGGNFGVCTSYTFTTNPVTDVTLYDITWDWRDAARRLRSVSARHPKRARRLLGPLGRRHGG